MHSQFYILCVVFMLMFVVCAGLETVFSCVMTYVHVRVPLFGILFSRVPHCFVLVVGLVVCVICIIVCVQVFVLVFLFVSLVQ